VIGWTFEDAQGLAAVRPKQASLNVHFRIPVAGIGRIKVKETRDPRLAELRKRQAVIAVIHVHPPRQSQLPVVVHALDTERFLFGLSQDRQQHRGKGCNHSYDHQKLNEAKTTYVSLSSASAKTVFSLAHIRDTLLTGAGLPL
jgi:hypothetical protein